MTVAATVALVASSVALLVFGLNLLHLSRAALRLGRVRSTAGGGAEQSSSSRGLADPLQTICVQVPIYNERYVAERVIDAVCSMEWPVEQLEVQVLDDSDDDTVGIVSERVQSWTERGLRIRHVRRPGRAGYKAGALAHGLRLTDSQFIAIFDADFVPPPDFLMRAMAGFVDSRVGFVQARWGHLDEDCSLFTRLQALSIDFHFLVEQAVRTRLGYFTNFTGTAGIWRRSAIEDAGGWSAQTLTEDLDLSYRAQLRGWRPVLLEDLVVPEELPVTVSAYRRQQARWATGSFQCAWRLLGRVTSEPTSRRVRLQAVLHLLSYLVPVLMPIQLMSAGALILIGSRGDGRDLLGLLPLPLCLISAVPWFGFLVAQRRRGQPWVRALPAPLSILLGFGLAPTVAVALARSLRPGGEFLRTPKYRMEDAAEWWGRDYVRAWDATTLRDLALSLAAGGLVALAVRGNEWVTAAYALALAAGLAWLSALSLVQTAEVTAWRRAGPNAARWVARHAPLGLVLAAAGGLLILSLRIGMPFEDSYAHWLMAASLAQTGHLHDPLFGMEDSWLPGYHVMAALILKVAGLRSIGALQVVNAGLGLATLVGVYAAAGSPQRGRLAVLLVGINPVFLSTATAVVAEPLLTACLVGAGLAVLKRQPVWAAGLALGACLVGTKAWLWLVLGVGLMVGTRARRAILSHDRMRPVPAVGWAVPSVAALVLLEVGFGFAGHSAGRAAIEVASASARGSLQMGPLSRLESFAGYSSLGLLPLLVLIPLGLRNEIRDGAASRLHLFGGVALVYLGAIVLVVGAGLYSGSDRYLYVALPGLGLLAAAALDGMPLLKVAAVAAALLHLAGYVPVLQSFARDNAGLVRAGQAVSLAPGALLTDSPVAAFSSGKAPNQIVGSRELPTDPDAALAWLRSHHVHALVLENISYYRAVSVFPDLARGQEESPFIRLGDQGTYLVPGGKEVHAYVLD